MNLAATTIINTGLSIFGVIALVNVIPAISVGSSTKFVFGVLNGVKFIPTAAVGVHHSWH